MLCRYRFSGGWYQADSDNPKNVMSPTGYVIMYAGCPVLWWSKLKTEITLSTTEAEFIALSQVVRKLMPFTELMKEVYFIFDIYIPKPEVFYKLFEDNQIYIAVTESKKFPPRKNIILLSIVIYKASLKRRLLGSAILIHENKQRIFSLSHSKNHYQSINKENYLEGDLKSEIFALTQGSLRIQTYRHKTQTHKIFDLKWHFFVSKFLRKSFSVIKNVPFSF